VEHVAEKVHNLGADALKVMLTNVAPVGGGGNTYCQAKKLPRMARRERLTVRMRPGVVR
jgi:hypothetical protein